jgi:hypothetical protein
MGVIPWVTANWFDLLQGVGIICGLLFTGAAFVQSGRSHRLDALLRLSEQHRNLWSEVHRRQDLARILKADVDLVSHPITAAENEFLNLVFAHFALGWEMAVQRRIISRETYRRDLLEFLTLPIPNRVWEGTKAFRDPCFVRFVESSVGRRINILLSRTGVIE